MERWMDGDLWHLPQLAVIVSGWKIEMNWLKNGRWQRKNRFETSTSSKMHTHASQQQISFNLHKWCCLINWENNVRNNELLQDSLGMRTYQKLSETKKKMSENILHLSTWTSKKLATFFFYASHWFWSDICKRIRCMPSRKQQNPPKYITKSTNQMPYWTRIFGKTKIVWTILQQQTKKLRVHRYLLCLCRGRRWVEKNNNVFFFLTRRNTHEHLY